MNGYDDGTARSAAVVLSGTAFMEAIITVPTSLAGVFARGLIWMPDHLRSHAPDKFPTVKSTRANAYGRTRAAAGPAACARELAPRTS